MHLFAFGLGYSAAALARRIRDMGWRISGTCRSLEKARALAGEDIEAHVFDPASNAVPPAAVLEGVTHIVSSVAPGPEGDPVLAAYGDVLAAARHVIWTGYLSTTGVYGDSGGAWVDETSAPRPTLDRAKRRLAAENAWLDLHARHGHPVHVFRLAGIYGPGRSAFDAIRAGKARRIDRPGQLFGRIHVDDIAATLLASMARPSPGAIYNVCDDEPAAPADVTAYACRRLGVEPPPAVPFEDAARDMTPMGRSFWEDNRRVRNRRIREELGVALAYPTYREGLAAILEAEQRDQSAIVSG